MNNQRGSVIIVALVILTTLLLLGAAISRTVQMGIMMAGNEVRIKQAFYAAESGLTVAIVKLNAGCLDNPPCSEETYIDYGSGFKYKFDVVDSGQVVNAHPRLIIDSYGNKHDAFSHIRASVSAETQPDLQAPVALYVKNDLKNNGVAGSVLGEYAEPLCSVDDIWTTESSWDGLEAGDYTADTGPTTKLLNNMPDYPFNDVFNYLKKYHDVSITNPYNNMVLGDAASMTQIFYVSGGMSVSNLDGYGILVVDGDFVSSGNISWHGFVLVNGNVTYNGGGHKDIYGSVLVNGNATLNGTVNINYNYCDLGEDLKEKLLRFKINWWNQL